MLIMDPQTPGTASSSFAAVYRSPGQISRRSNEDILQEINQRVDESDARSEASPLQNMVITANPSHLVASNSELSAISDDFNRTLVFRSRSKQKSKLELADIDDDISDVSLIMGEQQQQEQELQRRHQERNVLFTFRRRIVRESSSAGEGTSATFETTLNAKTSGSEEESMEDIVKRLQQKGASSGVLKFKRDLIEKIRAGQKDVVFVLTQVSGAKFSKDEFGRMMASEVASLTTERPILIEIKTEDVVEGETLTLF